ncbi:hypothetical protein MYX75_13470 [Acidobacteria bacterium AH-259-A15]|nr:hypothetical protein [Acidobacteria bacterium AH-259-A15]
MNTMESTGQRVERAKGFSWSTPAQKSLDQHSQEENLVKREQNGNMVTVDPKWSGKGSGLS